MQNSKIEKCYHHREVRFIELFKRFYLLLLIFSILLTGLSLSIIFKLHIAIIISISVVLALYVALTLKHFVIGCVLAYKSYAPMKLRDRCRFEPTCSTYMILAIEKYGLIEGFIKGVKRINRCHAPNGGVDYP